MNQKVIPLVISSCLLLSACGQYRTTALDTRTMVSYRTDTSATQWRPLIDLGADVIEYDKDIVVSMPGEHFFLRESDTMRTKAQPLLNYLAELLDNSHKKIVITGHSDGVGAKKLQQKRALKKARQVAGYLWAQGVPQQHISIQSVANKYPVSDKKGLNDQVTLYIMG